MIFQVTPFLKTERRDREGNMKMRIREVLGSILGRNTN